MACRATRTEYAVASAAVYMSNVCAREMASGVASPEIEAVLPASNVFASFLSEMLGRSRRYVPVRWLFRADELVTLKLWW
jgi:hypothetical protein